MVHDGNIGVLLEYSQPQGVLRRTGALGQANHNPAAIAVATKVKLARKAQADDRMEVDSDSDEHRWSSDIEALHAQSPSIIQISPILSDAMASLEPPPAFKMAQELTFTMFWYTLSGLPAMAQIHMSQSF